MSTPPADRPHDGERRKSLGKYVKRMSSVFKREKSSKSDLEEPSTAAVSGVPSDKQQQSPVEVPHVATQEVAQESNKAGKNEQEHPTDEPVAT